MKNSIGTLTLVIMLQMLLLLSASTVAYGQELPSGEGSIDEGPSLFPDSNSVTDDSPLPDNDTVADDNLFPNNNYVPDDTSDLYNDPVGGNNLTDPPAGGAPDNSGLDNNQFPDPSSPQNDSNSIFNPSNGPNSGNNLNNPASNSGAIADPGGSAGQKTGSNQAFYGSGPDVNNFSKNEAYTAQMAETVLNYQNIAWNLANGQLREFGLPEIKPIVVTENGRERAKKIVEDIMKRDISDRYNTRLNSSSWPRSTPEDINKNYPDYFDGPCHIIFRDYFSSDKDEHYKYFHSQLYSTSHQLLDLPRVKLETNRQQFCRGADCSGGNGGGGGGFFGRAGNINSYAGESGVLDCVRNEKFIDTQGGRYKRGLGTMAALVPDFLGKDVDLSFLGNEIFPQIRPRKDSNPKLCLDLSGNRFPWGAPSNKFFLADRGRVALQQKQDAQEFFQYLSSENGSGYASSASDKLPIGHTISDHDRFMGLSGNWALEVAEGGSCPTIDEMARDPLSYKQANRQDMRTSNLNANARYMIFKCGGGKLFRGTTLLADQSKSMCQSDRNADPYDGKVKPFWQLEIPFQKTVIPFFETRVC